MLFSPDLFEPDQPPFQYESLSFCPSSFGPQDTIGKRQINLTLATPHPCFPFLDQNKASIGIFTFNLSSLTQFSCLSSLISGLETHIMFIVTVYIVETSWFAPLSMAPSNLQSFPNPHLQSNLPNNNGTQKGK